MAILTKNEEEYVYKLVERITGSLQSGSYRKDILLRNIEKRIQVTGVKSLINYLKLVNQNQDEFDYLVSNVTIHTTSWFREMPHFIQLKNIIEKHLKQSDAPIRIWSAACSTGEEVYSIALVLEKIAQENSKLKYEIIGTDIDSKCIESCRKGIYKKSQLNEVPIEYHQLLLSGEDDFKEYFTLDERIINKCQFFVSSLAVNNKISTYGQFDIIFCRNVLIYFSLDEQSKIINQLYKFLKSESFLILGHSDSFSSHPLLKLIQGSVYKKSVGLLSSDDSFQKVQKNIKHPTQKPHLLIVDDSQTIRKVLFQIFEKKFEITEATSAENASEVVKVKKFDLVTLDLNMPGENGVSWLKKQKQLGLKTPVVIVSDSNQVDANKIFGSLENGAEDYIVKSRLSQEPDKILELGWQLISKFTEEEKDYRQFIKPFDKKIKPEVILIGASTGGPEALAQLLNQLPKPTPPIVIVQHISYEFSKAFVNRLSLVSGLSVGDMENDLIELQGNSIYLSLGDYHLKIVKSQDQLFIKKDNSTKVNGHRPSIDILFSSAAEFSLDSAAIILTGMGADGAQGMLDLSNKQKCFTLAQDQKSSVVFGMPKKAIELRAVNFIGNIQEIKNKIIEIYKN